MRTKWEEVGYITVDAGIVSLGDPCYMSNGENEYEDWDKFCTKHFTEVKDGVHQIENGKAVVVNSGLGDGLYPVEVKRDTNGTIKEVRIKFF